MRQLLISLGLLAASLLSPAVVHGQSSSHATMSVTPNPVPTGGPITVIGCGYRPLTMTQVSQYGGEFLIYSPVFPTDASGCFRIDWVAGPPPSTNLTSFQFIGSRWRVGATVILTIGP